MTAEHADCAPLPAERFLYGRTRSQYAVLELPPGAGPFPVAVLLHGGFWRVGFNRTLMNPLALDLLGRGWAVWNLEYRRLGIGWGGGGGWPETFADVAAGIDALADLRAAPLDLARVFAIGHSAGGQLALWSGARPGLPAGAPGAAPRRDARRRGRPGRRLRPARRTCEAQRQRRRAAPHGWLAAARA